MAAVEAGEEGGENAKVPDPVAFAGVEDAVADLEGPHDKEEHHRLVHRTHAVAEDDGKAEAGRGERDDEVVEVDVEDVEVREPRGHMHDDADERAHRVDDLVVVVQRQREVAPLPA